MSVKAVVVAVFALCSLAAQAADAPYSPSADAAFVAAKAAAIESLRSRLSVSPSVSAGTTLMEADDLLRRYQQAPAAQKNALRSQLDSAVARAELQLSQPR